MGTHAEIEHLRVKHWHGGEALITIIGYNGGIAVYKVEKKFDGATNKTDTTYQIISPTTALMAPFGDWKVQEGDSLALPFIAISPQILVDQTFGTGG